MLVCSSFSFACRSGILCHRLLVDLRILLAHMCEDGFLNWRHCQRKTSTCHGRLRVARWCLLVSSWATRTRSESSRTSTPSAPNIGQTFWQCAERIRTSTARMATTWWLCPTARCIAFSRSKSFVSIAMGTSRSHVRASNLAHHRREGGPLGPPLPRAREARRSTCTQLSLLPDGKAS